MASVGVRELKEHISEVLRRVEDNGEAIEITRRGKVIATLIPIERRRSEESIQRVQQQLDAIRRSIAADIGNAPVDSVALVREQRRNLTPDEWVPVDWRPET
jgi:prevent-host-death family protein